jgi:DNA-binding CsgD family transcriptional regulator
MVRSGLSPDLEVPCCEPAIFTVDDEPRCREHGKDTNGGLDLAGIHGLKFTAREAEVAHLAAKGLSNKEIAARLGISERTAKFHFGSVVRKTGVRSRTAFTAWYWKAAHTGKTD